MRLLFHCDVVKKVCEFNMEKISAFTIGIWGCSCRNARDAFCAAHKDWLDAV